MKFTKMHGLGNDYVLVNCFDQRIGDPPALARAVCDRHGGIGGDGLILMHPSDVADLRMEIHNADGSRAQMCGNGIRCVAKYAVEHGLGQGLNLRIDTDAGVKLAVCSCGNGPATSSNRIVESVRIDMGPPSLDAKAIPTTLTGLEPIPRKLWDRLSSRSDVQQAGCGDGLAGAGPPAIHPIIDHPLRVGGWDCRVTCVSMGNPHAVVFVEDLDAVTLNSIGPRFEHAPEFPRRINAHFVRVDSHTHVTMKTWERGSGATRACGTGACAVCVAGAITKRTGRSIAAALPGGDLHVEWAVSDHVYMTGPAVEVFTGTWPA